MATLPNVLISRADYQIGGGVALRPRTQDWVLTWEDIIAGFAILLLAVEIMKATRIGIRTIVDHMLAMALFIAMLVEFLLVERAGTSTFFLLLIIALVDVLVGFTVSVRTSTRQVEIQAEGPA